MLISSFNIIILVLTLAYNFYYNLIYKKENYMNDLEIENALDALPATKKISENKRIIKKFINSINRQLDRGVTLANIAEVFRSKLNLKISDGVFSNYVREINNSISKQKISNTNFETNNLTTEKIENTNHNTNNEINGMDLIIPEEDLLTPKEFKNSFSTKTK